MFLISRGDACQGTVIITFTTVTVSPRASVGGPDLPYPCNRSLPREHRGSVISPLPPLYTLLPHGLCHLLLPLSSTLSSSLTLSSLCLSDPLRSAHSLALCYLLSLCSRESLDPLSSYYLAPSISSALIQGEGERSRDHERSPDDGSRRESVRG